MAKKLKGKKYTPLFRGVKRRGRTALVGKEDIGYAGRKTYFSKDPVYAAKYNTTYHSNSGHKGGMWFGYKKPYKGTSRIGSYKDIGYGRGLEWVPKLGQETSFFLKRPVRMSERKRTRMYSRELLSNFKGGKLRFIRQQAAWYGKHGNQSITRRAARELSGNATHLRTGLRYRKTNPELYKKWRARYFARPKGKR